MNNVSMLKKVVLVWSLCLLSLPAVLAEDSSATDRPWPGKKSSFRSFALYNFEFEDFNCKVAVPDKIAAGKPWIWRARFWGHQPQTDIALLKMGFHVVYADVKNLYGSPTAVKRWDAFYKHLVETRGFDTKAVLEGMHAILKRFIVSTWMHPYVISRVGLEPTRLL